MWRHLIAVLICISLMIENVEHLFLCFFAICIFSLMRYLFRSFVLFLTGFFGTLSLLSFKSPLYVLHTSPLLDTWFAYIFSHSIACLFILLIGYFTEVFNFDEVQFFYFLLFCIMFLEPSLRNLFLVLDPENSTLLFFHK